MIIMVMLTILCVISYDRAFMMMVMFAMMVTDHIGQVDKVPSVCFLMTLLVMNYDYSDGDGDDGDGDGGGDGDGDGDGDCDNHVGNRSDDNGHLLLQ